MTTMPPPTNTLHNQAPIKAPVSPKKTNAPELLLPAGNLDHLRHAFAYGADAVYAGPARYSLRARNNAFDLATIAQGIEIAHAQDKLFFLTLNVLPHNRKIAPFLAHLAEYAALKPDALIMADPGLIDLVREHHPDLPIHLSVQANTLNWAAVKFWQKVGVTRIILSRELALDEVREIREMCPDMELEVFIHGALCIAYSGRCLLSGYINHRDPNQGTCTNACRWSYKVHEAADTGTDIVAKHATELPPIHTKAQEQQEAAEAEAQEHDTYLIEETGRPGELMPMEEDEHGTYVLNSKDLRGLEHVAALTEMGVDCFKIEGRTKSNYYIARCAQIYRQAIDDAVAGRHLDTRLFAALDGLANRGYTEGFLQRHKTVAQQNYEDSHSLSRKQRFAADILDITKNTDGLTLKIASKNKIRAGDTVEVITPLGNIRQQVQAIMDADNHPMAEVKGGGITALLQVANTATECITAPATTPANGSTSSAALTMDALTDRLIERAKNNAIPAGLLATDL